MKWLFIAAASALSLAVTTPASTAPDPLTGPSSSWQSAPYGQRLAQNDQQQQKQLRKKQKNRVVPHTQQQKLPLQLQQKPKNKAIRNNTQQQRQLHKMPKNKALGNNQQQKLQLQQKPKDKAIGNNTQQQRQLHKMPKNKALGNNQQQKLQLEQKPKDKAIGNNLPQQKLQLQQTQRFGWDHYQPGQRPPDWKQHQNFDRGAWQRNEQARRRYHWNSYQQPQGWHYRRWTYGMTLPSLFWGRPYWINSYWDYGLPNPPYGYVWVRYGNDALLVNVENGDILRVIYALYD